MMRNQTAALFAALSIISNAAADSAASTASATASATTSLVTSTTTPTAPASSATTFELDIILPRNQTYNISGTFPVVFALQNPLTAASLGPFTLLWDIVPWGSDNVADGDPLSGAFKELAFSAANFTDDAPYIVVDFTDSDNWDYGFPSSYPYLGLGWYLEWDAGQSLWGFEVFSYDLWPLGLDPWPLQIDPWTPQPHPDIMAVPACPELGAVIQVLPNATHPASDPSAVSTLPGPGDPCAVTVDQAMKSSVSSVLSSLATPPPKPTTTTSSRNDADSVQASATILMVICIVEFMMAA